MRDTAPQPSDRRAQILDRAEALARAAGYHGFSFREVAAAVGIRSASVHHHFPTKRALAAALAERYRARFLERLGPPEEAGAALRLLGAFRAALAEDDGMCLCGLLGAERDVLPAEVRDAVAAFFADVVRWTARAIGDEEDPPGRAETVVAGLEGAMILARATGDARAFDRVAGRLLADHR